MKNGEILRGLFAFRKASYSSSMVRRPPMPAPQMAPQRSRIDLAEIDTGIGHGLDAGGDAVVHELDPCAALPWA